MPREVYLTIGRDLARRIFEKRGNHSEAHVSEVELAAMLTLAAERGAAAGTRAALDEALNNGDGSYRP